MQLTTLKFSLIIPTKDRQAILQKSLNHLNAAVGVKHIEVIIVNDSKNELVLPSYVFPYRIVNNPGNGVATGRNFGAANASNEWIIFMDDDMLVKPEVFKRVEVFCVPENEQKCLNVNWVYPEFLANEYHRKPLLRYLRNYGFDNLKGWKHTDSWSDTELNKANLITSQFLVIHKKLLQQLGGYDESFPFAGFEDHDLAMRMRKAGVGIYIDPEVLAYHNEADRLHVNSWLERRKRGAITRRVAVSKGYKDFELKYGLLKSTFYKIVLSNKKLLIQMLEKWPKTQLLDKVYFLLLNFLLGAYSFAGYTGVSHFDEHALKQ
jgi:GT2 family glycosyltransferase